MEAIQLVDWDRIRKKRFWSKIIGIILVSVIALLIGFVVWDSFFKKRSLSEEQVVSVSNSKVVNVSNSNFSKKDTFDLGRFLGTLIGQKDQSAGIPVSSERSFDNASDGTPVSYERSNVSKADTSYHSGSQYNQSVLGLQERLMDLQIAISEKVRKACEHEVDVVLPEKQRRIRRSQERSMNGREKRAIARAEYTLKRINDGKVPQDEIIEYAARGWVIDGFARDLKGKDMGKLKHRWVDPRKLF